MRIVCRVLLNLSKATMASPAKKSKRGAMGLAWSSPIADKVEEEPSTAQKLQQCREDTAKSILKYKFNKKRVRIISEEESVPDDCEGIVYWMFRDCRVQDNWAFLFAQKLALKNEVPLHVCYCLVTEYLDTTYRQYHFLLNGLQKVAIECKKLNISFHLLKGSAPEVLPQWVTDHKIGAVVCDFNPLRIPMRWLEEVNEKLKDDIPLIQVDAHNIVPCWVASDKQEYSARTIRGKINSKLDDYLTEFPPLIQHPHSSKVELEPINWKEALDSVRGEKFVGPVKWAKPGYLQALKTLTNFIEHKLKTYATKRNNPNIDALSDLSPWFHSGQISVQRVALCVQDFKFKLTEGVNAYLEEAIVRRELADNFCFYCEHYDSVKGAYNWAQKTLDDHRKDKREYIYTLEQLEEAKTHDALWNSVQIQLVKEGKPHGFLRMYWCKKILEWTQTPEDALKYAIYLNDHYCLDGADPNGYTGCMWSICGIHDQGWSERAVFGKIRYMNYAGCKRKFDINAYIARYGGKEHKYIPADDTVESTSKHEPSDTKVVEEMSVETEKGIIKEPSCPTEGDEREASV